MVVGKLTSSALLPSVCDFKSAPMNEQGNLIREINEFEMGQNAVEITKTMLCAKGKGALDHNVLNRGFEKFQSVYNQAR